jgi:glyoxylase-like metal-dependent hydrolase (beta-lactamase superfamily II)
VRDVDQILVTHGHTDHFGCARWIQDSSGCRVYMHPDDAERLDPSHDWRESTRAVLGPLGLGPDAFDRYFRPRGQRFEPPTHITPITDGEELALSSDSSLRVFHRPGHTPGHLWAQETSTGALFVGDYLLASGPTNAGLEPGPGGGRRPMLQLYNAGLRELAAMDVPVVFPAHGPPITGHRGLIERRLAKSQRRTDRVLTELTALGEMTVIDLAVAMYGERIIGAPFEFLADVIGRVDLLVAEGRAQARTRDDGVWLFRAPNAPAT